jgi:hypothetical protein
MTTTDHRDEISSGRIHNRTVAPTSSLGWCALGLSGLAIAAWFLLPLIATALIGTSTTSNFIIQLVGLFFLDLAAVLDLFTLWRKKERSLLCILATAITFPLALFFTCIILAEGLTRL